MLSLRWKGALLASLHLVLWFQAAAQPTPPPTLFAGSDYDYAQCLFDVFSADANGDGFISNTNEEYLTLFNNIGASFCFEQTTPLTATQQSAYFTLVCDLVPNCLITSEIPTSGLNQEQIIMICEETRARIFTTCDEPTASPTIAMPSVPSTPAPSIPTISTFPPTSGQFEPITGNITLAQCLQDLNAADGDSNQRITIAEYLDFIDNMGQRVCYARESSTPTAAESAVFDVLVCLASNPCVGLTAINLEEYTPSLYFTLCSITYTDAMGAPECEGREDTLPPNATAEPTTVEPITPPTSAAVAFNQGNSVAFMVVAGATAAANMLVYMWM